MIIMTAEKGKEMFLDFVDSGQISVSEQVYNEMKRYEPGTYHERDAVLENFVKDCSFGGVKSPKDDERYVMFRPRSRTPVWRGGENIHLLRIYYKPVQEAFSREIPDQEFWGRG